MEQVLHYRGVTYVVGIETDGVRAWSVCGHPEAPIAKHLQHSGVARARGLRGSFKGAVLAARDAIDGMLGVEAPVEIVKEADPAAVGVN
jgi:ATP-dependent helicase YprA (DUF1998 family)